MCTWRAPRLLQAGQDGREPKPLVYTLPDDDLCKVVARLAANKCSMAPILTCDPDSETEVRRRRRRRRGGRGGGSAQRLGRQQ